MEVMDRKIIIWPVCLGPCRWEHLLTNYSPQKEAYHYRRGLEIQWHITRQACRASNNKNRRGGLHGNHQSGRFQGKATERIILQVYSVIATTIFSIELARR